MAILGLIVLLTGIGIRPEAAPAPGEVAQQPEGLSELRAELAGVRGQLEAVQRELETVSGRLEELEETSLGLAVSVARLEALEGADVPVVVDGPVTAISSESADAVDLLRLTLRNISRSAAFPLNASSTRVSYYDEDVGREHPGLLRGGPGRACEWLERTVGLRARAPI